MPDPTMENKVSCLQIHPLKLKMRKLKRPQQDRCYARKAEALHEGLGARTG